MPELAENVVIDARTNTVTIDGKEFPHYLDARGITVEGAGTAWDIPIINLPVIARNVTVIPGMADAPLTDGQRQALADKMAASEARYNAAPDKQGNVTRPDAVMRAKNGGQE